MEQSLPNFAKGIYSTLRNSRILEPPSWRSAYTQMDAESENEDDDNGTMSHSLFYSTQQQQQQQPGEESIPLTDSHEYSDRSQLIFSQDSMDDTHHNSNYEESPKPSAIYLDIPTNSTPNTNITQPKLLSESLLPTTAAIPSGITTTKAERKLRDPFFTFLYGICLIIFIFSGIIILFTTNSHSIEDYAKGTTFSTIKDSAGLLAIMMTISLITGTIWIYVLRTITKTIVWGTIIGIPLTFLGLFLWTMIESLHKHYIYPNDVTNHDTSLTMMSFIPLLLGIFYAYTIYKNHHRIQKTISIIELACDVLRFNPGIILVSLILLVVFLLFTIVWIVLFNRLWLIGYLVKNGSSSGMWVVNDNAYLFATFYIFMYLWTAAILINMQRFALSAITAQWYFHRHEANSQHSDNAWQIALTRASTTSFGTLAFGGLVLSIVQFLHLATRYMKSYVKKSRPFVSIVSLMLAYIEAWINQINHYVIGLAGITGDGFCMAARSGTKIFRRNLISGLIGDLITRLVLYVGALVISLASGFGAYIFAGHQLHSSHGLIIGLIAAIVPMYMSQFFSYTMMSIVDATFLCYAIDLDTGSVHLSAAHDVFSGFD
ncbi:plasma-membrane choline transporter-domain-containing protein [Halteromyces radiatus]|uniref:plasma-membrane choline transporter-domain-containing protein n=1 Tax=Halteromyces radiatus TaxID=101107 RepID=UPI00221E9297|nr:plasma-membrane choline transporter-domain-containing protein [Halteromyces radiatus]KAI8076795.1 plasma-membrane choline transporter-domain-containing protein [Halteromyces radiatus]